MDSGSTRFILSRSANVQCSMLIVAGHQVKQEKKCESLQILELTEASKQPEPTQTLLLQDMDDGSRRSSCRPGQDHEDGSSQTAPVVMFGQA